jgi:hypothetical protein
LASSERELVINDVGINKTNPTTIKIAKSINQAIILGPFPALAKFCESLGDDEGEDEGARVGSINFGRG